MGRTYGRIRAGSWPKREDKDSKPSPVSIDLPQPKEQVYSQPKKKKEVTLTHHRYYDRDVDAWVSLSPLERRIQSMPNTGIVPHFTSEGTESKNFFTEAEMRSRLAGNSPCESSGFDYPPNHTPPATGDAATQARYE